MNDPILEPLVAAWVAARDRGSEIPPEVLCRDCPELLPPLRQRIAALATTALDRSPTGLDKPAAPGGAAAPARLGGYRVERVLGEGGMGTVYLAVDEVLGRAVAVKTLRAELASKPGSAARFLREARSVAAVEHEHVVPIYAVGEEGGVPYFVMPLLAGEALDARVRRDGPLPAGEVVRVGREVAEGLAAAHARGLIHRDVKPSNVWLAAPRGAVRLLDFGLARAAEADAGITGAGEVLGTPAYMAPEQAAGGRVDHRADLFGLGCVLYEAATGRRPFAGPTAAAALVAVATHHPPPARAVNAAVPEPLSDLIARLMAKDPGARPASAAEVAAELARIAAPTPLVVWSPAGDSRADGAGATAAIAPAGPARARRVRSVAVVLASLALIALAALGAVQVYRGFRGTPEAITVGVLHSRSGTMAVSEGPVAEAALLAVDEINASGGLLGRPVKAVEADGRSNPDEFARQAERLLADDRAVAIFGCWTSASRKAVRQVLEGRGDGLLFYPVQYEGIEQSPRVVYLGPAPNQQLIPAIDFLTRPVGAGGLGKKRLYLVGSDYLGSRVAHEIIKDQVKLREKDGVRFVGEAFVPLGSAEVSAPVVDLERLRPDVVVNTISGGTNFHFFRTLRERKVTPAEIPVLSVSLTEHELMGLDPAASAGDYLAASYFQSVDRAESREFLRKFRDRYGPTRVVNDPMAAAYTGVHLWASAVRKAGTTDPAAVREALRGMGFDGARARVRVDPENLHAWLPARIGRVRPDGFVDLVAGAGSEEPIRPVPYPPTRGPQAWDQVLLSLQLRWDGKWQAPDKK